jgi:hypothetical protein
LGISRSFFLKLEEQNFNSKELFDFSYTVAHNQTHSNRKDDQLLPNFNLRNVDSLYRLTFLDYFGLDPNLKNLEYLTAFRALINSVVFHSLEYNRRQNSNSYTVNFLKNGSDCFGEIQFFFLFETKVFCLINEFIVEPNARHILKESSGYFYDVTLDLFNRFYRIVTKKNHGKKNYVIIDSINIKYKCMVVLADDYYFITKLKYDFEHD